MTVKKLANHNYAAAKVYIYDNGAMALVSYKTVVLMVNPLGYLSCYGMFSATTRKHIGWFAKEYTDLSYQMIKRAYEDGYAIHITNGDIVT